MKNKVSKITSILFIIIGCLITNNQSAKAANIYGTWDYRNDSPNDSLDGHGGSTNELLGIAGMEDETNLYMALYGQFPLTGLPSSGADDGNINFGDIFLNFSPESNFNTARNQGSLYGVQFAPGNNSGVSSGVWSNVNPISVAAQNYGYYLQGYYNTLNSTPGRDKDGSQMFGYMSKDDFSNYMSYQIKPAGQYQPTPNVIGSSNNRITDVSTLNQQELLNLGLDLNQFSGVGSQVVGVKFAKAGLPKGNFFASLLLNCNNDGIVSYFQRSQPPVKKTPEPSAVLGLMLLIGGFYSSKKSSKLNLVMNNKSCE